MMTFIQQKWFRVFTALALMFVTAFFAVQVMDVRKAIPSAIVELMAETPMRLLAYGVVYCIALYSITLGAVLGMLVFIIDVNIQYAIRLGEMDKTESKSNSSDSSNSLDSSISLDSSNSLDSSDSGAK
jgi:succinate dehydrogenase hydrophobic anchor subunit